MTPVLSGRQVAWFRLGRAGLVGEPPAAADGVARDLLGIQSQVEVSAALGIRNRLPDFDLDALAAELTERRRLIKTWGPRSTLHLYADTDWPLFTAALSDAGTWWTRRLAKREAERPDFHRALDAIEAWLLERGAPATRHDLREALPAHRKWLDFGAGVIFDLARRGVTCHAGWEGSKIRFAHRGHWRPDLEWSAPEPAAARAELARRFLGTYGPADARDFAFWLGIKAAPAREAMAAVEADTVEVELDGRPCRVLAADLDALAAEPPPAAAWPPLLLHRYETLLLAHRDKGWIVDEGHYKRVWRKAGVVEAVVVLRGRIAGTWRYDKVRGGIAVTLQPFGALTKKARGVLERRAAALVPGLGAPLVEFHVKGVAG